MLVFAIDFDGTLVEHRFPKVGPAVPRAFEWLRRLQALGARLILLTMRSDGRADGTNPLRDAVTFCRQYGIEFWQVNENTEQDAWTSSRKVYAHRYVDDAAVGCPLVPHPDGGTPVVDWSVVGPLLEAELVARRRELGEGN
jgi:hypothetical protein